MEVNFCKFCAYGMFCSSCVGSCVGTAWIKWLSCLQKKKINVRHFSCVSHWWHTDQIRLSTDFSFLHQSFSSLPLLRPSEPQSSFSSFPFHPNQTDQGCAGWRRSGNYTRQWAGHCAWNWTRPTGTPSKATSPSTPFCWPRCQLSGKNGHVFSYVWCSIMIILRYHYLFFVHCRSIEFCEEPCENYSTAIEVQNSLSILWQSWEDFSSVATFCPHKATIFSEVLTAFFYRELSVLHQDALCKFKRAAPHLQFSDLHKEIFNVDSWGA